MPSKLQIGDLERLDKNLDNYLKLNCQVGKQYVTVPYSERGFRMDHQTVVSTKERSEFGYESTHVNPLAEI